MADNGEVATGGPEEDGDNPFLHALRNGNAVALAGVLRQLKSLGRAELAELADALDPKGIEHLVPYRLDFKRTRAGKPTDFWIDIEQHRRRVRAIKTELETEKKVELAIKAAAKKLSLSPSTLRRSWSERQRFLYLRNK
jgi:hypothetical protein